MSARRFSLEPMSLPDVGARGLVDAAAATGFDYVSMVLYSPVATLPVDPIVADAGLRRETIARMRETGVRLHNVECFNLTPEMTVADCATALACAEELGATNATAIAMENADRADVLAKLRDLADRAAEHGIAINLEFLPLTQSLRTLADAAELVRAAERDNVAIVVDLLHVMRGGGSVAEVAALDPRMVGTAQICDGPLRIDDPAALQAEAGTARQVPGEGEFPVAAFVAALPPDAVLGVEVPQVALIGKVTPEERARRMLAGLRGVLDLAPA